ncbi:MAG: hypothetical protein JWO03_1195 [Bacteroidetes bacterium]|nr:hypothetical protein [Bacteroidota bacterium]
MKKVIILLAGLCLSNFASHATGEKANIKINWGPDYELPKKHEDLGFFGNPTDGYVGISHQRGKDIIVQHFTADLKLTNESEMSMKEFPKNYMIDKIMELDGKYYIFYSTYDDDEILWCQELDVKKGEMKGKAKQIANSKNKLSGTLTATGFYQFQTSNKWKFIQSADKSKLVIWYRLKPKEKKDALNNDVIGFWVFDNKLSKLWNKDVTMPYTEKMMDNEDYQVDGAGAVYLLGKIYEEGNKDSKDGHPNYHYELMQYTGSGKSVSAKFDVGEKYVVDAALIESNKGQIICTGYYSKSKRTQSSDGVFFFTYDEGSRSMKSVYKGFYEFPNDVIKQFETKRSQKKVDKEEEDGKDVEVANLQFRNLDIQDDGSFTLFGEQYHEVTYTRTNSRGGSTSTTRYYFDDIYVMRIGADGDMKWVKKIPKRQVDVSQTSYGYGTYMANNFRANTEYLSFYLHTIGKNNYVFYIDNQKNSALSPDQLPAAYAAGARGELICVKIDESGNLSKSSVFDFKEEKLRIMINKFNSVTPNQIIGRAYESHGLFQFGFSKGKALKISVN